MEDLEMQYEKKLMESLLADLNKINLNRLMVRKISYIALSFSKNYDVNVEYALKVIMSSSVPSLFRKDPIAFCKKDYGFQSELIYKQLTKNEENCLISKQKQIWDKKISQYSLKSNEDYDKKYNDPRLNCLMIETMKHISEYLCLNYNLDAEEAINLVVTDTWFISLFRKDPLMSCHNTSSKSYEDIIYKSAMRKANKTNGDLSLKRKLF